MLTSIPFRFSARLCVVIGMSLAAGGAETTFSSDPAPLARPTEYEVKAAFLYNFALFVAWPEGRTDERAYASVLDTTPLIFATVGDDPFGRLLDQALLGKEIGGRRVQIERFARVQDITSCHVLFVPSSQHDNMERIVRQTAGKSVLLVGEHENFARIGGVINFFMETSRVRFEVNVNAAKERRLNISSKLLNLARIVEPTGVE